MIVSIDESPAWRAQRTSRADVSQLLEALFRSRRGRRPATRLEVLLLADALECSEATIEEYFAPLPKPESSVQRAGDAVRIAQTRSRTGTRLLLMQPKLSQSYSPTKPA